MIDPSHPLLFNYKKKSARRTHFYHPHPVLYDPQSCMKTRLPRPSPSRPLGYEPPPFDCNPPLASNLLVNETVRPFPLWPGKHRRTYSGFLRLCNERCTGCSRQTQSPNAFSHGPPPRPLDCLMQHHGLVQRNVVSSTRQRFFWKKPHATSCLTTNWHFG